MPHRPPLSLTVADVDLIRSALKFYAARWTSAAANRPAGLAPLRQALETEVPVFPCYILAWPGVTAEELAPVVHDDSENLTPEGPRNGMGFLAVGTTDAGEVVINLPRDMTGHIAFTADQAEYLGSILHKQAEAARAMKVPPLECPDCGTKTGDILNGVCTSDGCPMVKLGLCVASRGDKLPPRGCAACDRGDFTIGHADNCPVVILRKMADRTAARIAAEDSTAGETKLARGYSAPGAVRICPVCKGTGDKGNPTRGFVLCNECDGTGEVLTHIPAHVKHMLGRVLPEFEAGRPARAMALLTSVVGNIFARLGKVEDTSTRTANEASMRANGIIPD